MRFTGSTVYNLRAVSNCDSQFKRERADHETERAAVIGRATGKTLGNFLHLSPSTNFQDPAPYVATSIPRVLKFRLFRAR